MKERQTSFAGGEFSPSLWGRSDLQAYATGAKTVRNFYVSPEGVLLNRPGTHRIARMHVIGSDGTPDGSPAMLIPFVFAADDALLLAFTHEKLQIFKMPDLTGLLHGGTINWIEWQIKHADGRRVVLDMPYQVFPTNQLPQIRTAQLGNILTIVHPDHSPVQLKRLSTDSRGWEVTALEFVVPDYQGVGSPGKSTQPYILAEDRDYSGVSDNSYSEADALARITEETASVTLSPWQWAITQIVERGDGSRYESRPVVVEEQANIRFRPWAAGQLYNACYYPPGGETFAGGRFNRGTIAYCADQPGAFYACTLPHVASERTRPGTSPSHWHTFLLEDWPVAQIVMETVPERTVVHPLGKVTLDWRNYGVLGTDGATIEGRIVANRIYRGQDGFLGYLHETTESHWEDDGATPDFSSPPPGGVNPFEVYDTDGNLLRTEHPKTVTYFQNRLLFGGTKERGPLLLGSAVGEYLNHDVIVPANAADAFSLELAGKSLEDIQALVPRQQLLVMTASGEWVVTGSAGALVTPNSIAAYSMTRHGCGSVDPVEVQGAVLFITFKDTLPKALFFSTEGGGYRSVDIGRLSRHLFKGHKIVSWAYAEDPYSVLWAVRDDGVLLSLTISFEEQMVAWARHDLGGEGLAVSVATVPEGTEDSVYLVARRGAAYDLERLSSRVFTDIRDAVFLDGSVTKSYRTVGDAIKVSAGLLTPDEDISFLYYDSTGTAVTALGVLSIGDVLQVESGGVVGRLQIRTLGGTSTGTVLETLPDAVETDELPFTVCFDTVGELDPLEGQSVMALADGHVAGPYTVVSGAVDLGFKAAIATVGLAITSEFESLAAVADRTKRKNVRSITVEVEGSRGGYVGPTLDGPMEEMRDRDVDHGYGAIPLIRSEQPFVVSAEWEEQATCAIRQTDPLPLEVLGLTRDFELGG